MDWARHPQMSEMTEQCHLPRGATNRDFDVTQKGEGIAVSKAERTAPSKPFDMRDMEL